MRALFSLALMLALLPASFACAQSTQGAVYAVDYDQLYSIDPGTLRATLIGKAGFNGAQAIGDLSGLTTAPDGTLYAASDTIKALVRLDPKTGRATVVGSFAIPTSESGRTATAPLDFGMAYGCSGKLWLSSTSTDTSPGKLWQVNPDNGATTLVGTLGHTISGLTIRGGKLLGAGARDDNAEGLYAIDTDSAAATLIGNYGDAIPYAASVSPGVNAQGDLMAAINYVPPRSGNLVPDWSDLAQINPDNGAATIVGTLTGPDSLRQIGIRGLTFGAPDCAPRDVVEPNQPRDSAFGVPASGFGAALLEWLALAAVALTTLLRRR